MCDCDIVSIFLYGNHASEHVSVRSPDFHQGPDSCTVGNGFKIAGIQIIVQFLLVLKPLVVVSHILPQYL